MAERLAGKVAVITGGASGIGAETVRLFVREGAKVVIADILDSDGETLAGELGSKVARFCHTDVSNEADVARAVDLAVSEFGGLDCIFNNAGFGTLVPSIDEVPMEIYDRHMAVLVRGVFLGIKHAARVMKPRGTGSIINTASVAGVETGHGSIVYSTAKAAVIHMSKCAATELGEAGIRVNSICPGGIVTPIFGKAFGMTQDAALDTQATVRAALSQSQPIRRAGEPIDIAQAALWLASSESSFVNGHALVVDGGLTCGRGYTEMMTLFTGLANAITAK
jgi:NAD(P)-dependent dehydrogenase (short-subunit alcohol dehydrogenase family)